MNAARTMFAMLVLAAAARADEAKDRLARAIADLGEQDGYVLKADWTITIEGKVAPTHGTVDAVVRERGDFLRLHAVFDGRDMTVYQKGARIAVQNLETKEWGPADDDKRTKFVTKMFNLKSFLTEAAGMTPDPAFEPDAEKCLVIRAVADPESLKKLLSDAEAGAALINNELRNARMTVHVYVNRESGLVQQTVVEIEGDAIGEEIKKPAGDGDKPGDDWEDVPEGPPKPGEPEPEPKKEEAPKAPAVEHVKIWINALANYKQDRTVEVPEGAKKVLGLGN